MIVFVAGATGVIGKQVLPPLVVAGREVHGMTRTESKQAVLEELGAVPVVADALGPDHVAEAVDRANPVMIVHQLTAIGLVDVSHFDRDFAFTNRLRTERTDHLLSAGRRRGATVRGADPGARASGRERDGAHHRDPRRLEREGQARAGVAPAHPSWRQGFVAA
jgi:uncharacterized protein YbjT (DUF2867 family)